MEIDIVLRYLHSRKLDSEMNGDLESAELYSKMIKKRMNSLVSDDTTAPK